MNGYIPKIAVLTGVVVALSSTAILAVDAPPKSGTTSYTTHFVFVPKSTVDIPGVGKAVALEATGPTENTAGLARRPSFLRLVVPATPRPFVRNGTIEIDGREFGAHGPSSLALQAGSQRLREV